jgi:pimeloyl-ACP methyl ester carboxylesterase
VVAFDAPAHGESSGELSSLPQFAEAILTVDEGYGPFDAVIGHSMGGAAASLAMVQGLQVKRAVYIAPPADAYQWFRNFSDALGFSEELEEETRRRMEERLHFDFSLLNAKELGPRISTPLLVIHDHQDKEVAWTEGRTIVQSTHHAQLLSTEGLGHRRILNHPEVIRTAIDFIQNRPAELAIERNFGLCSRCGNELERRDLAEMCEDCEFEFELFDPPARRKARAFDVGNAAV